MIINSISFGDITSIFTAILCYMFQNYKIIYQFSNFLLTSGHTEEITYTADFTDLPNIPASQVSIGSADTYVALELQRTYRLRSVYLQLKSSEPNGLIMYRGGKNGDFFAVELIQVSLCHKQLIIKAIATNSRFWATTAM